MSQAAPARNVTLATPLLLKMDADTVSAINVRENLIDRMEVEISNYLIKMTDQELNDDESHEVTEAAELCHRVRAHWRLCCQHHGKSSGAGRKRGFVQ